MHSIENVKFVSLGIVRWVRTLDLPNDDLVADHISTRWLKWKSELGKLQGFATLWCHEAGNVGKVVKADIHHLSDAIF